MIEKINFYANKYSKKVGLDLNYFIKNGFWISFGYSFGMIKILILSFLLANILSKEVYGQYVFIMTIIGIASIFTFPGMSSATIQAISKGYEGTYFKTLKIILNGSFFGSLFLIIVALYGKLTGHNYGTLILILIAILFPLYSICGHYVNYFNGKKQFKKTMKLFSIFSVISTIIISASIYFTKDILWIILATVLSQILIQGYYSTFIVKKNLKNNKIKEENIKYGKKVSLSYSFNIIASRIDTLLITFFLGFEKLAIYTIITLIPNQLKTLFGVFNPLILPKIAEKNKITGNDVYKQLKKVLITTIIIILIYIILSPILFKYIYSQYLEYVWLSMLFSISVLITSNSLVEGYLQAKLNDKKINQINIFYSILNIILLLITVQFGLFWIIIGRIIHRLVIVFNGIYILKKIK